MRERGTYPGAADGPQQWSWGLIINKLKRTTSVSLSNKGRPPLKVRTHFDFPVWHFELGWNVSATVGSIETSRFSADGTQLLNILLFFSSSTFNAVLSVLSDENSLHQLLVLQFSFNAPPSGQSQNCMSWFPPAMAELRDHLNPDSILGETGVESMLISWCLHQRRGCICFSQCLTLWLCTQRGPKQPPPRLPPSVFSRRTRHCSLLLRKTPERFKPAFNVPNVPTALKASVFTTEEI